jgi:hypothetical protein
LTTTAVHLRDGRGGERLAVELGEGVLERPAQLFLEHGADDLVRFGRHAVAALLELVDELVREDALAGGDDLSELDVGRAERLGRFAQPARQSGTRDAGIAATAFTHGPQGQCAADLAHHAHRSPPGQAPRRDELGHLALRNRPNSSQRLAPHEMVGVEHPGRVVAERAVDQIGRGVFGEGRGSGRQRWHTVFNRQGRAMLPRRARAGR